MDVWHGSNDAAWDRRQDGIVCRRRHRRPPVTPPTRERVDAMSSLRLRRRRSLNYAAAAFRRSDVARHRDQRGNGRLPAGLSAGRRAAVDALAAASEFNLIAWRPRQVLPGLSSSSNGPIAATQHECGRQRAWAGNRAERSDRPRSEPRAAQHRRRQARRARHGDSRPAGSTRAASRKTASSPWPALHVERGFDKDSNVVTIIGIAGSVEIVDSVSNTPQDLAQLYTQSMLIAGSAGGGGFGLLGGGEPLLLVPPEIANPFSAALQKAQAKWLIWERAVLPLDRPVTGDPRTPANAARSGRKTARSMGHCALRATPMM